METLVLVMTDVEGSTRLWAEDAVAMNAAMARHHAIIHAAVAEHGGRRPADQGEGDAVFAAFRSPTAAIAAVLRIQRELSSEPWPTSRPLRVRIGMHLGEVIERDNNLYGDTVNRCARLRGLGSGGQTLVSSALYEVVRDQLPEGASLLLLGEHRMRDLSRPERVWQLDAPGLPDAFPPLASLERIRHNLPIQTSSFVGRERELAELVAMLGEHRLVTLTGFGGMGKTRLALQAAAEPADGRLGDVWFVDLAATTDPDQVPSRVGEAMGLRWGAGDPTEVILAALREHPCLLVLDNLEQVLGCAPFVARLLAVSKDVRVLGTSREPLRVRGERQVPIPPLGLPAADSDTTALTAYEAARLFVDRAVAVRADFVVDNATAPAVAAICSRLDGHPLALELAAARLKVLSVDNLLSRLDVKLSLLTGGSRDMPARHQTLRATIAWSYDALSRDEQILLANMSVFEVPADLEAVEAIGGIGVGGSVLNVLESLVEKSLVRTSELEDDIRYGLLASIRDFVREQLDQHEISALSSAHAEHYYAKLQPQRRSLAVDSARSALIRRDLDHIRAALAHLAEAGESQRECLLIDALGDNVINLGHLAEALQMSERVLALSDDARLRAAALTNTALACAYIPDLERGRAAAEAAVVEAERSGDAEALANAIAISVLAASTATELDAIQARLDAVLPRVPEDRRELLTGELLNMRSRLLRFVDPARSEQAARALCELMDADVGKVRLALVLTDRGDWQGAADLLEEVAAQEEPFLGRRTWQLLGDAVHAVAELGCGRLERARELAERSFSGQVANGSRPDWSAVALAGVERAAGDPGAGVTVLDAALDPRHGTLDGYSGIMLIRRAVLHHDLGESDRARADLEAGRPLLLADVRRGLLELLIALALRARLAEPHDPRRAAELVGCLQANRRDWVLPFGVEEDLVALSERLRRVLGAAYDDALASGGSCALLETW